MNITSRILISAAFACFMFTGCGRKPYQLAVRDGRGVEKDSHVFWDMGGKGTFKVVGDVTDVGASEDKSHVLIKFELREEYRTTIRENVAGAVLRDPDVAQGAFVLLMGGVGEDKEPLLRGVTIQEALPSVQQAFFDWLQKDFPEYVKKLKEDASKAFDQASEWASQKAGELKEDTSKAFDQASEWANQKADELKKKAEEIKQDMSAPAEE